MGDTGTQIPQRSGQPTESSPDKFDQLIFQQELNEVYLLLDFISGNPSKLLSDLDGRIDNPDKPGEKLKSTEVATRVAELRYPPEGSKSDKAKDAAFLMLVKDELNAMAYPARGLTIAYTVMFAEDQRQAKFQTAQGAFPGLAESAKRFRRTKNAMSMAGLFITVAAAILLWQVTYGVQLTGRFEEAKKNEDLAESRLYDELDKEGVAKKASQLYDLDVLCNQNPEPSVASQSPRMTPTGAIGGALLTPAAANTTPGAANTTPGAGNAASGAANDPRTSTTRQMCDDYAYRHALLRVTVADVGRYSESRMFRLYASLLPVHQFQQSSASDVGPAGKPSASASQGTGNASSQATGDPPRGRQEDALSVAGVLAMMANYMLPILFGLAGTMAALVRSIQDKVTASVLSPRDRALSLIRLPLGTMAGVCVGLFFNPAATQTTSGLGALTLSASGIAFLAGYGAEAFFRMLDTLITRVFSVDDAGKLPAPASRRG